MELGEEEEEVDEGEGKEDLERSVLVERLEFGFPHLPRIGEIRSLNSKPNPRLRDWETVFFFLGDLESMTN